MISEYGRYRIVKELGKGTMGVVYQAHDPQIDRMVALKILRPDRVTSESFVARFLKEADLVVTPGVGFGEYGQGYIRMALTVSKARIKEALERIKKIS